MTARAAELLERLAVIRSGIAQACSAAGRDPSSVLLVAVSKTWPADDIDVLHQAGVRDFGENRVDELAGKAARFAGSGIRWHYLGQIQSKKAAAIGRTAAVVHSVDRDRVLPGLSHGAADAQRQLEVLVQVSLAEMAGDAESGGRAGAPPDRVPALAQAVSDTPWLQLAGVMTLPPRSADPGAAFARLASIATDLRRRHPDAVAVSAGMSHDYPAAIAAGATHVRIGSALFGERNYVR